MIEQYDDLENYNKVTQIDCLIAEHLFGYYWVNDGVQCGLNPPKMKISENRFLGKTSTLFEDALCGSSLGPSRLKSSKTTISRRLNASRSLC